MKLDREHYYIITVVACSITLIVFLDILDDHASDDFQVFSTVIQDIGFVLVGLMLTALLFIQITSLKDRLKLERYEKKLRELKQDLD